MWPLQRKNQQRCSSIGWDLSFLLGLSFGWHCPLAGTVLTVTGPDEFSGDRGGVEGVIWSTSESVFMLTLISFTPFFSRLVRDHLVLWILETRAYRQTDTDRETETERETETDRPTDRETDRQRQTDTDRQTGTGRQRETERQISCVPPT